MRQRSVDQVGEDGLDDRVPAVGDVSDRSGLGAVGEERVVPPDREQLVEAGLVTDPAHDQPGGDGLLGGGERGERGNLGDLGVADQLAGVGIVDRARVVHRGPGILGNGRDRLGHRRVLHHHQGEPGPGPPAGHGDRAVAVGGVAADHDLTGGARGRGRCATASVTIDGRTLARAGLAGAEPDPGDHRRAGPGGDRGRQRRQALAETCLPAILVWP